MQLHLLGMPDPVVAAYEVVMRGTSGTCAKAMLRLALPQAPACGLDSSE